MSLRVSLFVCVQRIDAWFMWRVPFFYLIEYIVRCVTLFLMRLLAVLVVGLSLMLRLPGLAPAVFIQSFRAISSWPFSTIIGD